MGSRDFADQLPFTFRRLREWKLYRGWRLPHRFELARWPRLAAPTYRPSGPTALRRRLRKRRLCRRRLQLNRALFQRLEDVDAARVPKRLFARERRIWKRP